MYIIFIEAKGAVFTNMVIDMKPFVSSINLASIFSYLLWKESESARPIEVIKTSFNSQMVLPKVPGK